VNALHCLADLAEPVGGIDLDLDLFLRPHSQQTVNVLGGGGHERRVVQQIAEVVA